MDGNIEKKFMKALKSYKRNEYIIDGHSVRKEFFSEIFKPQNWVDSSHMDALLSLLWRRHGDALIEKRTAITDTFFTRMLCLNYPHFKKSENRDSWTWNSMTRNYVKGIIPNRSNKLAWYQDVDTLYAPMNWGTKHWVALVIDLITGKITILDPLHSATGERKMGTTMEPLVDMLATAIDQLVPKHLCKTLIPSTFVYERVHEVSKNHRSGDCGIFSIKFMELHCQDLALGGITDKMADNMRMHYALDVMKNL